MALTFLYIDDDRKEDSASKVQGFEQAGLKIITCQPQSSWEEQLKFLKEKEASLDGLILDLRLDDFPNEAGDRADFRGTSLAQEIRTRQKEGDFKPLPIVLFSGNEKLKNSLERSGKDLFEICIDKGTVDGKSFDILSPRLYALAEDYKILTKPNVTLRDILNVDPATLDERFVAELSDLLLNPSHVIARFLINELIEKQGLLIDEQILAARLGVDIANSSDWVNVLESLSSSKYNGVFSAGWKRWWMPSIEIWWRKVINSDEYLRSTAASRRVTLLKDKLALTNIISPSRIPKCDSDEFWNICKGYGKPLDPVDGLMIDGQENLYPWQDAEYVSIEAAIKRKNIDNWTKVAKVEEYRLKELEEQFRKPR